MDDFLDTILRMQGGRPQIFIAALYLLPGSMIEFQSNVYIYMGESVSRK